MRLGNYITTLTRPELDKFKEYINASDDETIIIEQLAKHKSLVQIADNMNISVPTLSRKISKIYYKLGGESMKKECPLWEKVTLSIEEAAEYSNIGINKLYDLTNSPLCTFVLFVGKKRLIKRKEFEKYLETKIEI